MQLSLPIVSLAAIPFNNLIPLHVFVYGKCLIFRLCEMELPEAHSLKKVEMAIISFEKHSVGSGNSLSVCLCVYLKMHQPLTNE